MHYALRLSCEIKKEIINLFFYFSGSVAQLVRAHA